MKKKTPISIGSWIFSHFPTTPERDEILVVGTVFYAESNGRYVCFFREMKNKKITALQS